MKFYLAHNYAARDFLRNEIAPYLELQFGHKITSDWLIQTHEDRRPEYQYDYAKIDIQNIEVADALVLFSDQFGERAGKGKYIEFGAAYMMGKLIFVIGDTCDSSVFFFLNNVTQFKTFTEFCEYLESRSL